MTFEEKERSQLQEKGCIVSKRTVQRCLFTEFRLKLHIPDRHTHLTKVMKKKRQRFAEAHAHWTINIWKRVLFSNKSLMKLFLCGNAKSGNLQEKDMRKITPYQLSNIFLVKRCRGLYRKQASTFLFPKATINHVRHVELFKNKLQFHISVNYCLIFMHGWVPCYRTRAVKQFLEQKNAQVPNWLGNSPNLILIENLLNLMKAKIAEKYFSNLDELQQVIKKVSLKIFSRVLLQPR